MITKEQLNILSVFEKDIFGELTFRQIKELSRQNSNNIIQLALKEFQKQGIITIKKIADIQVYSLNLKSNLTLAYLNLINEAKIKRINLPADVLNNIQNKILKDTEFFILIVFGSYAKENNIKKSDLDIAVIIETEQRKKDIIPYLETAKRREITKLDCHAFTRDEFLAMLNADSENLGKQVFKNNIIYYGFIPYCNMIKENTK